MQHINKFRNIKTRKTDSAVLVFDADTDAVIFKVQKPRRSTEWAVLCGKDFVFELDFTNSNSTAHKATILKLCGEPTQEKGFGSKSTNPHFNRFGELSKKGFVKVAEHLAQFETTTFAENTNLNNLKMLANKRG
jgi:hypothetical protein